jgi:hypothetical protein
VVRFFIGTLPGVTDVYGRRTCRADLVTPTAGPCPGRTIRRTRAWIERYGIRRSLDTDWKNVYVRVANAKQRVTGAEPLTQFARMCAALGSHIIPASSPQAKGRIVRNHGTQQDRPIKKLRRRGVADVRTANTFLEAEYWADHNALRSAPLRDRGDVPR